jgi:hypothetical protein
LSWQWPQACLCCVLRRLALPLRWRILLLDCAFCTPNLLILSAPVPACRIEHPQGAIDSMQYGEADAAKVLRGKGRYPVAEYRLAAEISAGMAAQAAAAVAGAAAPGSGFTEDWYHPLLASAGGSAGEAAAGEGRGVYSFCMCPGGQIVPTSTSEEELCLNGMSFSKWVCPPASPLRACQGLWLPRQLLLFVACPAGSHQPRQPSVG